MLLVAAQCRRSYVSRVAAETSARVLGAAAHEGWLCHLTCIPLCGFLMNALLLRYEGIGRRLKACVGDIVRRTVAVGRLAGIDSAAAYEARRLAAADVELAGPRTRYAQ